MSDIRIMPTQRVEVFSGLRVWPDPEVALKASDKVSLGFGRSFFTG